MEQRQWYPAAYGPVPAAAAVAADRWALLVRQRFHLAVQVGLPLKADAGQIRQCHVAVDNFDPVGEATERLKQVGIGLVAPEPKARGDVQRHLVTTVRNAAARGPTMLLEHLQRAQVFDQAVAQGAVELKVVAVRRMPP